MGHGLVRDFIVVEGEWETMEGVIPWVSCPGCVDEDNDGLRGVAETEDRRCAGTVGRRARDGCRECVCKKEWGRRTCKTAFSGTTCYRPGGSIPFTTGGKRPRVLTPCLA